MSSSPNNNNSSSSASNNNNNKNPVGDWDVDDLLFWRALESHPPIQGLLKQVLQNGWTLCIPPDTSIPIGYDSNNQLLPMPTESFSKMHVLIPLDQNGNPMVMNNNKMPNSYSSQSNNSSRNSSCVDLMGLNDNSFETRSNTGSEGNNNNNKSFAQTIMAPMNSLKNRTASFFSSIKNSVTNNNNNNNNTNGNSPRQNQQQPMHSNSPRKSNATTNNNNRASTMSTATTTGNNNHQNMMMSSSSPNTTNNNNGGQQHQQNPFQFSRFIAGGRKDLVVYRRTVAEELLYQQDEAEFDDTTNNNNNNDDDDEDYCYEEEEYYDENDGKLKRRRKRTTKGRKNSLLREICKKKRFSDDSHSKSLDSSDLGVLVTEWVVPGSGNNNNNKNEVIRQKTVARIVFEQKVINTESKKSVTFLVLDRPLNAGPGAIPAHLRTFGFSGQSVTDAVDFLFDADSEFVNDEDSLFSLLEKKAAKTRSYLDESYSMKLEEEEDDDENSGQNEMMMNDQEASQILDKVRDYLEEIIETESETWNMAIVPAAHPLSRRRLERSFQIAISSFLHSKVYQIVFGLCSHPRCNPACNVDEVTRWKEVRRRFEAVAGGDDDPVHLGLAPEVWNTLRRFDTPLASAVQKAIDSVSAATNPFDKVQRLEKVYQAVVDPTSSTTNNNGLQSPNSALQNQQNQQQVKKMMTKLAADNVVPLLAYYLLRSERCELLPVHISYIRLFGNETVLGGASSNYEYALATLEVALSVAYSVFDPVPTAPAKHDDDDEETDDEEDEVEQENHVEKEQQRNRQQQQKSKSISQSPRSPISLSPTSHNNNNNNNHRNTSVASSSNTTNGMFPPQPPPPQISSENRFEASVIRSTNKF